MNASTHCVDLSRNESSLGPNPRVLSKLSNSQINISKYPCQNGEQLKRAIAEFHNCQPDHIVLGNGSVGLLEIAARALVGPGDEAILPFSTFPAIPQLVKNTGAHIIYAPFKNWYIDLDAIINSVSPKTKLILLVNPNNPTGTHLSCKEINCFLNRLPSHISVIVDEAYIDFVVDDLEAKGIANLAPEHPNLLVARTFSKAHGLAGLRVGYCITNKKLAKKVHNQRMPYTNSPIALSAAECSIKDTEFVSQVKRTNQLSLQQIEIGLKHNALEYIPSIANFISINFGCAAEIAFQTLRDNGVIVSRQDAANLPSYLRVSMGTPYENIIFLNAINQLAGIHNNEVHHHAAL